ncbi:hypothetical protein OHP005_05870 [Helicobacter pylori]|nr:hypothetical protein OHP005_05870 [Helicobacter pylori]
MIASFEVDEKVLRELETIAPLSNDYRDGDSISNLNEPSLIQKPLTSQEKLLEKTQENPLKTQDLSPLEQAEAEKLAKLESERLESEKEFLNLKEQENMRKAALKKKLEHERGNAGNIESQTKIEVGEDIPTQALAQIPKSRVRLNEREIYDLDYAIVKAKDLKPSFTTGGTQKRTDMNEEQIKSIAQNFDPKKIFGSGGFEDLPIILHDGQVIAGNHNFDKATHPNVGDSNLALLMFNMPRTKTQGIELLNRWQKEFSNDIKSYEKVKKMFVDNAGSFHNLIHDMSFPNVSLNAYLAILWIAVLPI